MLQFIFKFKKKISQILKEKGITSLILKPFSSFKQLFFVLYTRSKIKKLQKTYTLKSLIEYSLKVNNGFIKPTQRRSEILKLLTLIKREKSKYILEIGTASGGTLFLLTRTIAKDAVIISIDLPGGSYGGGYSELKLPLYRAFRLPKQKLFLIRANSHSTATLNQLKRILNGNYLDFLFIDGDHSYKGAKMDFEMYTPLVKKNGIVALHDIAYSPPEISEVYKFWEEIKKNYEYKEFIEERDKKGYGIGIVRLNKKLT